MVKKIGQSFRFESLTANRFIVVICGKINDLSWNLELASLAAIPLARRTSVDRLLLNGLRLDALSTRLVSKAA